MDFDESKPPAKLPYNMIDDPWHVAQKFLDDNELPQTYLDTVAKFIMQNAPGAGTVAPPAPSQYADPFTGRLHDEHELEYMSNQHLVLLRKR